MLLCIYQLVDWSSGAASRLTMIGPAVFIAVLKDGLAKRCGHGLAEACQHVARYFDHATVAHVSLPRAESVSSDW